MTLRLAANRLFPIELSVTRPRFLLLSSMSMSALRFYALLPIPLTNSELPRTLRMFFYGEKDRLYRYGADDEMNCATIPFLDRRL